MKGFAVSLTAILLLVSSLNRPATAQQVPAKPDSSEVYRKIETFSKKNKFTKVVYGMIFKPVATRASKKRAALLHMPYRIFQGKIIRNIAVVSYGPFGYSVYDTTIEPHGFSAKVADKLHVTTQDFTVRNIVLFRETQPFDSLLVKESERLLRSQPYVGDVFIAAALVHGTADSVDIRIAVLDRWSFIPDVGYSSTSIAGGFTEENVAGLGHQLSAQYTRDPTNRKYEATANYSVPNVRNTYISTMLHYSLDGYNNLNRSIAIVRPFYSPLAKWAAGVNLAQVTQNDTIADTIPGQARRNLKYATQDYWAGKAIRISNGNTEVERTTNAIIAGRYFRARYFEKPDFQFDSAGEYSNQNFYLVGVGISGLRYFQDNFIFDFGAIEDVPIGKVFGITGGYQIRGSLGRPYWGGRCSFGDYYDWGYLSSTFEYGTFIYQSVSQQGVFVAESNFFSNLYRIGKWQIRQFAKPQITWGVNRYPYDSLTINNANGIRGFGSSLQGTRKVLLTLQTQSYAPWKVVGFRFGPFVNGSLGILGNATTGFTKSPVYSQLGIGTLIRNDYLVVGPFQLSIAYYPSIPGVGKNVFNLNSYRTGDFGFGNFGLGEPDVVPFQ